MAVNFYTLYLGISLVMIICCVIDVHFTFIDSFYIYIYIYIYIAV
jgi:hypothetical protein